MADVIKVQNLILKLLGCTRSWWQNEASTNIFFAGDPLEATRGVAGLGLAVEGRLNRIGIESVLFYTTLAPDKNRSSSDAK